MGPTLSPAARRRGTLSEMCECEGRVSMGGEEFQCGGMGMKTGGVPDIFERALMSASLAPNGFR